MGIRIATTRERFREVLGDRPRARVLIETSTESEWARCLEELGHEPIVAAPGFAPMYGMRTRRMKTDLRDARALERRGRGARDQERLRGGVAAGGAEDRAGDSRTRCLLVQASQRIRYSRAPETLGLRMWAKRIAMLRDGAPFDPGKQVGLPAALAARKERRARPGEPGG